MEHKSLSLILRICGIYTDDERNVKGISDRCEDIKKDWVYLIYHFDNINICDLNDFVKSKKCIIIWEGESAEDIYHVDDVKALSLEIYQVYFKVDLSQMRFIGISGTSGKTSVATILMQIINVDYPTMLIGTGFVQIKNKHFQTNNTTPGIFQLGYYLQLALQQQIKIVIMEVSSHAIDQDRIHFIRYDLIIYTNILVDHLDYHLSRTHYRYTKYKLRTYLKEGGWIIYNSDNAYMQELCELSVQLFSTFGTSDADNMISNVDLQAVKTKFYLNDWNFECSLLGMFNVYNVAAAIVASIQLGIEMDAIQARVKEIKPIIGRLQAVHGFRAQIWVDYAHTVDAFEKLCQFAQSVATNRLILVVGCGGNRDQHKRPIIGNMASKYGDVVFLTSDNPRNETPSAIIAAMWKEGDKRFHYRENRYFAIKSALKTAQKDDIIVIVGKGDENVQIVKGKKYQFQDVKVVEKLISEEEKNWSTNI